VSGRLALWRRQEAVEVVAARQEVERVATTFRAVFDAALDAVVLLDDEGRIVDANRATTAVVGTSPEAMIGRRVGADAPPERRRQLDELLRTLRQHGSIRGDYEFTGRDGRRRFVEFTSTANFIPGRHLSVIRDATDRRRTEHALRQRAAEQADIADLGLLALAGEDFDDLIAVVVDRVASRLDVAHVSVLGRVRDDELIMRAGGPTRAAGGTGGICIPIRGRDGPWGALCVDGGSDEPFSSDDVNFLGAMANTLSMALDSRRAGEEVRRRSAEIARLAAERQGIVAEALNAEDRTRERISQQLHDDLLQTLFVIRQDVAQIAATATERRDLAIRARDGLQQAIHDVRAAVFDLHPVVLERGGLASALGGIADHYAARSGFEMSVVVSPDAEGHLDRLALSLVRELVSNVARHADAQRACVKLERHDGELSLEVTDDGRGIDPAQMRRAVAHGHIGLASVAHRVEALGGRFDFFSPPSGGTVVRAAIPIRPAGQGGI
jgi:PAS domain S-box-containing protein